MVSLISIFVYSRIICKQVLCCSGIQPLIRFRIVKVLSRNALSVASLLFSSKFFVGIAIEPPIWFRFAIEPPIWFRFIPFANYCTSVVFNVVPSCDVALSFDEGD